MLTLVLSGILLSIPTASSLTVSMSASSISFSSDSDSESSLSSSSSSTTTTSSLADYGGIYTLVILGAFIASLIVVGIFAIPLVQEMKERRQQISETKDMLFRLRRERDTLEYHVDWEYQNGGRATTEAGAATSRELQRTKEQIKILETLLEKLEKGQQDKDKDKDEDDTGVMGTQTRRGGRQRRQ
jgi:hypothetical protein